MSSIERLSSVDGCAKAMVVESTARKLIFEKSFIFVSNFFLKTLFSLEISE